MGRAIAGLGASVEVLLLDGIFRFAGPTRPFVVRAGKKRATVRKNRFSLVNDSTIAPFEFLLAAEHLLGFLPDVVIRAH